MYCNICNCNLKSATCCPCTRGKEGSDDHAWQDSARRKDEEEEEKEPVAGSRAVRKNQARVRGRYYAIACGPQAAGCTTEGGCRLDRNTHVYAGNINGDMYTMTLIFIISLVIVCFHVKLCNTNFWDWKIENSTYAKSSYYYVINDIFVIFISYNLLICVWRVDWYFDLIFSLLWVIKDNFYNKL